MNIEAFRDNLTSYEIFHSSDSIMNKPTAIGYDKQFRWAWFATQLNTFVVVSDYGDEEITPSTIEEHIAASFAYAKKHYTGWPRGLQSGLGVISITLSTNISEEAKEFCLKSKSGKKWAGFSVPVTMNTTDNSLYYFEKNPMWGRVFYPFFKSLIEDIT